MANENCLFGMECPQCGSEGGFRIDIKCTAYVTDDGVDECSLQHCDWEDDAYCECVDCGHGAKVATFREASRQKAAQAAKEESDD